VGGRMPGKKRLLKRERCTEVIPTEIEKETYRNRKRDLWGRKRDLCK
jgi:hypothetical protein